MAKEKEIKTNAMRILDRQKIKYEVLQYECDEFIDGLHTAEKTGAPVEQSFKTLVAQGKSKQYYVLVLPIAEEVDLKKAAKAVGEKSIEMIHVKDITAVSGYVRGGCSPIGMKKQYPTVIQECAAQFDKVYVSGGRIGTTLCMAPEDLKKVSRAEYADFYSVKTEKTVWKQTRTKKKVTGLFLFVCDAAGKFTFQKRNHKINSQKDSGGN